MVPWPSGKARVCKTLIRQFKSGRYLQKRHTPKGVCLFCFLEDGFKSSIHSPYDPQFRDFLPGNFNDFNGNWYYLVIMHIFFLTEQTCVPFVYRCIFPAQQKPFCAFLADRIPPSVVILTGDAKNSKGIRASKSKFPQKFYHFRLNVANCTFMLYNVVNVWNTQ